MTKHPWFSILKRKPTKPVVTRVKVPDDIIVWRISDAEFKKLKEQL